MKRALAALCAAAALLLTAGEPKPPLGLPPLVHPPNDPPTAAKIALGRTLFFDARLSADGKISCATCHSPAKAFCDLNPVGIGIGEQAGNFNTPTLLNIGYMRDLFWDGREAKLEQQILYPITHPREMNMTKTRIVAWINQNAEYRERFRDAFGVEKIEFHDIGRAIAAFERTLVSGDAPFDRFFFAKDEKAISESAKRGWGVFRGKGKCIECHTFSADAPFFTDSSFHNSGLGWEGAKPQLGRYVVTRDPQDRGRFRTPSLRNVAVTAPYMHDGRFATLADVLAHYERGGIPNPYLDPKLQPLQLSDAEKRDLLAFLESLTGTTKFEESHAAQRTTP